MSRNVGYPRSGIGNVGEYQVSGHTLVVTGSAKRIYLTHVASSITLASTSGSGDLSATFYDGGHEATAFTLPGGTTARFKGKFLTFDVPVGMGALVEVTNIPSASYNVPTRGQLFSNR